MSYLIRVTFGWGFKEIGLYMNRNHATIIHSEFVVRDLITTKDSELMIKYMPLINFCKTNF